MVFVVSVLIKYNNICLFMLLYLYLYLGISCVLNEYCVSYSNCGVYCEKFGLWFEFELENANKGAE